MSSRGPSREDPSPSNFQAVVTTAARRDTSHRCVDYHRKDLADQHIILAHLSRRKCKDNTLISFQEVWDPKDRVSSSSKGVFSRSKSLRPRPGCCIFRSL